MNYLIKVKKLYISLSVLYLIINIQSFFFENSFFDSMFDKANTILLVFFLMILSISILTEFFRVIDKIGTNRNTLSSVKWLFKWESIKQLSILFVSCLPILAYKLFVYLNIKTIDFNLNFMITLFLVSILVLVSFLILFISYIVFTSLYRKELEKIGESLIFHELENCKRFLTVSELETKFKHINIKFENSTKNFIRKERMLFSLKINVYFSILLNNNKKATTPPLTYLYY
ncbi:hypothetical protein SHELI_v1c01330 [Spiroplasma helicoides]|uniref:Uncharacterized protein n=1 Tax=Spiroplasma helicoides TaxID=216938 RepID=A0A1B3SJI3_9MOLU|nr:hypothetical protein [Spiroplasma helicoides]AOG60088.1 hypothetical protein SHELI_v1c01330 [Spiroplasma helicoides]